MRVANIIVRIDEPPQTYAQRSSLYVLRTIKIATEGRPGHGNIRKQEDCEKGTFHVLSRDAIPPHEALCRRGVQDTKAVPRHISLGE